MKRICNSIEWQENSILQVRSKSKTDCKTVHMSINVTPPRCAPDCNSSYSGYFTSNMIQDGAEPSKYFRSFPFFCRWMSLYLDQDAVTEWKKAAAHNYFMSSGSVSGSRFEIIFVQFQVQVKDGDNISF